MRYYFSLFLLVLSISSYAQNGTFKGLVKDSQTKEPLLGATVILIDSDGIGASTNFDGEFAITCPSGKVKFTVSFVGKITDTLSFEILENETIQKEIYLIDNSEVFEALEIKAGKFDKKIEEMTVSMEVIRPELIENKNTRTVETVLDQTPGVNILDGEPQIRGGSGFTFGVGSKVAILVDDMPMLSGDAGRPEWGFIPIENIDQIEVIKGAASVLSGASALSGAIHIKTASPTIEPVTKVNLYSGKYSDPENVDQKWWSDYAYIHGGNFLHSRKIKSFDVVVGGLMNFDHGYIGAPMPGEFVVDTITNFGDSAMKSEKVRLNVGLKYFPKKIEQLSFGLNANAMYNNTNLALAWLDDTAGFYRAYPGGVILQRQIIYNIDPSVVFVSKKGGKHALKSRWLSTSNEMTGNQSNESDVYFADYQFKKKYTKFSDIGLVVGVSTAYTNSFAEIFSGSGDPNNTVLNFSGYSQLEKKIKDRLNLSFGYRYENYTLNSTQNDVATIVRGGLNFKLFQGNNLRMSFGQGYRYPTIAERYIKTTVGAFGVFDNPNLKPETSKNIEAGLRQGFKIGKLKGYVDVAAFQQTYENTIEYLFGFWDSTYTFAIAGFKFLNTGKSIVKGIDASIMGIVKTPKKSQLTFLVGYNYILPLTQEPDVVFARDYSFAGNGEFSYNSTSLDSTKRILKYRFLHTFKGDIEYSFRKKIAIGISARYFSKIQNLDKAILDFEEATANTGGTLQTIRYIDYYNSLQGGNTIIDARVSYAINKHHKVAFVVSNLLNRTYSLRPLKAEPMRTMMVQYSLKL